MPTYKNNGSKTQVVKDIQGKQVNVFPGKTVETGYYFTDDRHPWIKISDKPYYNPLLAVHSNIKSFGNGDWTTINLHSRCDKVEIWNNSGALITVLLNVEENVPGYLVPVASVRTFEDIRNYVYKLILQFSSSVDYGEIIIHELEE